MASRRCSTCAINFPKRIHECPVCGGDCWLIRDDPDEWWEWKATQLQQAFQEGAEAPRQFPIYMVIPVEEVLEGVVWRTPVQAVYHYDRERLILKEMDVIETPRLDWHEDAPGVTTLWEVTGTQHGRDQKYYLLRQMDLPDFIPQEWEAEFGGN